MNQNWALGILGVIMLTFSAWVGATLISHGVRISALDSVISEPVEKSLNELRDKTNKQADACNSARGNVTNNAIEIGHLKETVAELKAEVEKLRDKP